MRYTHLQLFVFGTALAVTPCTLLAQTEPSATSPNSRHPHSRNSGDQTSPSAAPHGASSVTEDNGEDRDKGSRTIRDKEFLRKAAQGGLAEVKLGQLASQKAGSDEVKKFGETMVQDHSALNDSMKPIAESMGVQLPDQLNKQDEAEYDKLQGLSDKSFDREYLTYMRRDHHKDLREFRQEAANATDPALKAAVLHGEKVIAHHTQMVDHLAVTNGVAKAANRR